MNIARAQFQRLLQKIVDRAHDRGTTCEIAKAVDVIVGATEWPFAIGSGERRVIAADLFRERGRNIFKRGNFNRYRAPEHDLGGTNAGRIGWIGNGKVQTALLVAIRESFRFPQEAAGKVLHERGSRQQLRQMHTRQPVKGRHLVGKFVAGSSVRSHCLFRSCPSRPSAVSGATASAAMCRLSARYRANAAAASLLPPLSVLAVSICDALILTAPCLYQRLRREGRSFALPAVVIVVSMVRHAA